MGWHVAWLLVLLLAPAAFAQGEDGPMRLSEVNRMIRADQTPAQVIEAAATRGIDFELNRSTLRRLDQWGFTEEQIEQLRRISAGEDPGDAEMEGDPAEGEAGEREAGDYAVGYRDGDGTHDAEKRRIERAIEAAHLGYERIELSRVTLYCERRRARGLAELLAATERAVIDRFPASIANAIDPRSAHIVVIDGESEWARWLAAFQDSYEQDGITYPPTPEGDFKTRMANSPGYTTGIVSAVRGDLMSSEEQLQRSVTYHLGHLMMTGASRPDGFLQRPAHDTLVTGFGNLTETIAMGSPSVMVYSYSERDLDGDESWDQRVRGRFSDGKITGVTDVWTFSTDTMEPGQYAEAWSIVSLLCQAPEKFAEAVLLVQQEEASMPEAVRTAYELDDARLLQGWRQWAGR